MRPVPYVLEIIVHTLFVGLFDAVAQPFAMSVPLRRVLIGLHSKLQAIDDRLMELGETSGKLNRCVSMKGVLSFCSLPLGQYQPCQAQLARFAKAQLPWHTSS